MLCVEAAAAGVPGNWALASWLKGFVSARLHYVKLGNHVDVVDPGKPSPAQALLSAGADSA